MATDIDLEVKTIKRFVIKDRQERYILLVSSSNKRKKFLYELAHFHHLNHKCFEQLKGINISDLMKMVSVYVDCYAISENNIIDAKRINTDEALKLTLGYGMGTLLIFGDAEMVYYEGEDANDRWIGKENT